MPKAERLIGRCLCGKVRFSAESNPLLWAHAIVLCADVGARGRSFMSNAAKACSFRRQLVWASIRLRLGPNGGFATNVVRPCIIRC